MSDQVKWNALENPIYLQLPTYGPVSKKIKMLEIIPYQEAFNLFGVIKKEINIRKPSRRLKQIKDVRNIIKDLAKAMKSYSDVNKHGALVCLMDELKKRRQVLRSGKDSRKRRWSRKPAKKVITPKVKSESKLPKSVLNEFIQKVPSDPDRTVPF